MDKGIKITVLSLIIFASTAAQALSLQAFSNVHISALSPAGITGVLTSTSIVSNGVGRLLAIDADHFEIICNSGRVDDSDGVLRVAFNTNSAAASDGLHVNFNVFVQYRIFAEHIFRACGNGSSIIVTVEKTSTANGGAC